MSDIISFPAKRASFMLSISLPSKIHVKPTPQSKKPVGNSGSFAKVYGRKGRRAVNKSMGW